VEFRVEVDATKVVTGPSASVARIYFARKAFGNATSLGRVESLIGHRVPN